MLNQLCFFLDQRVKKTSRFSEFLAYCDFMGQGVQFEGHFAYHFYIFRTPPTMGREAVWHVYIFEQMLACDWCRDIHM